MGWLEATTPMFLAPNSSFNATTQDVAWIGSISSCGTPVAIIIYLLYTRNKAKKKIITHSTIMFGVTWLTLALTKSTFMMGWCFFTFGVTFSILNIVSYAYIDEIATPKNREVISVMRHVIFAVGKGFIFGISVLDNYIILSLIPFIASVTAFICSLWIRESPCYLISQNLNDLAKSNLCWLRAENNFELVSKEFEEMQKYVEEKNQIGLFSSFKKAKNTESFLLYMIIFGLGYANCNSVVLVYGPEFVANLKFVNGNIFLNIYSAIHVICFLFGFYTVKRFSRRNLLFYGFIITFIIHVLCGLCFYFIEIRGQFAAIEALATVMLVIFMMAQILTVSTGLEVLKTEVFAFQVKEFCLLISGLFGEASQFFILQIYFPLRDSFGDSANFVVYSLFSMSGILCVYFFMRDTKNKTLLQIQTEHTSYGLFVRTL